jgi:hypothetical protein
MLPNGNHNKRIGLSRFTEDSSMYFDRGVGPVFVDILLFCLGAILLGEQLTAAMWQGRRLQRVWSSGPSLPAGKQESDSQRWLLLEKKFVGLPFFCSYKYVSRN